MPGGGLGEDDDPAQRRCPDRAGISLDQSIEMNVDPTMRPKAAKSDAPRGASVQAYRVLRDRIVSGALRPGDPLSEPKVAAMFGVSRTPIREVFKRLRDEGLLEILPQVGTFVSRIDIDQVREDQFVRETLECRAVELAAERVASSPQIRREIEAALERQADLVERRDTPGFMEIDDEFHALLFRLAGHEAAWRTVQAAKVQFDRVRHLSLEDGDHLRMVFGEHRAIVGAVLAGNGAAAAAAMREHLRTVFAAIESIAHGRPDFFVCGDGD